ncbi:MAG: fluoride efflux transporter CrcB [Gammaproteobacteria bacterium]|nr:fluoride efflux transporter CrcB [Gammaproteobacteria bacterium]
MWKQLLFIACGGAAGSVMRFGVSSMVYSVLGRSFPYGTLTVNVVGSFLMGLMSVMLIEKFSLSTEWRAAILIGFLGAFTTFSTFSLETMQLIQQGELSKAGLNMLLSVVCCIIAIWLGFVLGKPFL